MSLKRRQQLNLTDSVCPLFRGLFALTVMSTIGIAVFLCLCQQVPKVGFRFYSLFLQDLSKR